MKQLLIVAAIAVVLLGSIAGAQPTRDMKREARERLNLTSDQEKSIKDIKSKSGKDLIDLRASMQKKRIDLGNAWNADSPDRAQVEGLMKDIGTLQLTMKMVLFDADQAVNKLLTAEQRKVYKELKQQRREGMNARAMHGRKGGPRDFRGSDGPDDHEK